MKVWIDQDLCTGDGLCAEIAPDVFTMMPDGLAYVREGDKIFASSVGNPEGAAGVASFLTKVAQIPGDFWAIRKTETI